MFPTRAGAGVAPPKAKPSVVVPEPTRAARKVLTSVISVHEDPSHCSTFATLLGKGLLVSPETSKAAVEIPIDPPKVLAVFKSATSVQADHSIILW